jgi:hypothetical protein
VTLKRYVCLNRECFKIFCKSIDHIQPNKEIWGEYGRDTYGRKDPKVVAKEVPLYGGRDRGVTKYGCSFNPMSHGKISNS